MSSFFESKLSFASKLSGPNSPSRASETSVIKERPQDAQMIVVSNLCFFGPHGLLL